MKGPYGFEYALKRYQNIFIALSKVPTVNYINRNTFSLYCIHSYFKIVMFCIMAI